MQRRKYFLPVFFIVLWVNYTYAQQNINDQIEQLAEQQNNEAIDFSELQEALKYYLDNPLNINSENRAVLVELRLINVFQLEQLNKHIKDNGNLLCIEELQSVIGFDANLINKLKPYIYVSDNIEKTNWRSQIKKSQQQINLRYEQTLETEKGFIDSNSTQHYFGNPMQALFKYRAYHQNQFSVGFTIEKDAGEPINKSNGIDFYSAHLFLKTNSTIKTLTIGDYYAGFGQGIIFNNGFSFGKTSDVVNIKQNIAPLRPFVSANESQYLRGVGVSFGKKNIEYTFIFSKKYIDANVTIIDSASQNPLQFSSIIESGLHRTAGEIEDRKTIDEQIIGGHGKYSNRFMEIGITAVYTNFDASYLKSDALYNRFSFTGKQLFNYGVDYSCNYRNLLFFGETGLSDNGGQASQNGLLMALGNRVSIGLLHRFYSSKYQTLKGRGFAESSSVNNETGMYSSIELKITPTLSLSAYNDIFKNKWIKYSVDGPSYGNDWLTQLSYSPNKKDSYYLRIRKKIKPENKQQDHYNTVENYDQLNLRVDGTYFIIDKLKLHSRIEILTKEQNQAKDLKGYLLLQDFTYVFNSKFNITFRYMMFDCDNYDSRIYAYESDVPNYFYIPSFYNNGNRYYGMINYQINTRISLWARFSQTVYFDRNVIGSGSSEINGNKKSEVKLLVRVRI